MSFNKIPKEEGMYNPFNEHDACGVGFVCNVEGEKSNAIVNKALEALTRMEHRGAVGADAKTGDGAGILIQMPDRFFRKIIKQDKNIDLPEYGNYGSGLVFLPQENSKREKYIKIVEENITKWGLELITWRDVPVDSSVIGQTARKSEPKILQLFIKNSNLKTQIEFERKLYVVRKAIENIVAKEQSYIDNNDFYIVSLSSRVFNYKGQFMTEQVQKYYLDLQDSSVESALALVHSRFSTNTFPSWDLAQPFRMLAHNGEINTLRGNVNSLKAKESKLESEFFTDEELEAIKPVTKIGLSDSATLDNVFELLTLSGRSLQHSMLMMVPSAWENNKLMDKKLKDFYKFHASFMEPWDGPATLAFTDGESIGAVLDRNGLRPARYIVTKDNMIIAASELGVLNVESSNIKSSGRIEPGKIFIVDTKKKKIYTDEEVKTQLANRQPYGEWIAKEMVDFDEITENEPQDNQYDNLAVVMKSYGYTREDEKVIISPMISTGKEPTGSMGNDIPHAVLSKNPQMLYTYFKQQFAQVTNPAIDPIREEIVMSNQSFVGPKLNILTETQKHARTILVKNPIVNHKEFTRFNNLDKYGFKSRKISTLFNVSSEDNLEKSLKDVFKQVDEAIDDGVTYIILSDRGINKEFASIPALLAVGGVHHHLIREQKRSDVSIILESGEPREVHHFATLFGYGADVVYPYLALDVVENMVKTKFDDIDVQTGIKNYIKAINFGIKKIMSKIGISTLQSYRGAQIFEALGVHQEVIDLCFAGTVSRIGGVKFKDIAWESITRHKKAYAPQKIVVLETGGIYAWRRDGEKHLWNPTTIFKLQQATRQNSFELYKEFAEGINNQDDQPVTLRGLLKFKKSGINPIDINEVEPVENIVQRFVTGAMSFGSISRGAHESLAIAMNRLKGQSNTGEGGEEIARFTPLPNGDSKRSAIKQVASGRFGVNSNYLTNADEIQIKIAQGAKPGEGGQLPGHKVSVTIANTRFTTPGVTLISPPPHHDIYSIEDLKQLIFDLKNANPSARISVKLVSNAGVGTVAAGVAKAHADMILISGGDGGTGASPLSSLKHAGVVWELGLSETHQTLVANGLRNRVRLQTDGQMRTGKDVAIAAILGAEEYGFSTSALIVLGCVMLRHCHLNNCSVGIATQDPVLERKFSGKPEWIVNYLKFVAEELREIMASLGIKKIDDLIGRTDLLDIDKSILPQKAKDLDLSKILYTPKVSDRKELYKNIEQNHEIDNQLDWKIIKDAQKAFDKEQDVELIYDIVNIDRSVGAILSNEISKRYGLNGLPNDTIKVKFNGIAGQSFGAFLAPGVTFELEGIANDYVGKGLSGGKIIIYPDKDSTYFAEENFIIGNTTFYGASRGEAYIRGKAGERFCIRNSGVLAVVEGVGDHGCEYMTGGRVVIIGETGRNFGAGMSGGIAYVYDKKGDFIDKCNMEMIEVTEVDETGVEEIHGLLHDHLEHTNSPVAKRILDNFGSEIKLFKKVMPLEYKRILEQQKLEQKIGVNESE